MQEKAGDNVRKACSCHLTIKKDLCDLPRYISITQPWQYSLPADRHRWWKHCTSITLGVG